MKATKRTGVYMWKCIPTGKVYIGSAAKCFRDRFNNHRRELRKGIHYNRYLQHAWNKYDECDFAWIEIEICPEEKCVEREQYWLDFYDATNPEKGFNLSPTAGSCLGTKHGPRSKELIEAQQVKIREYLQDPAYRKKIGDATREGLSDPEIRKKMSASSRARWSRMTEQELKDYWEKHYETTIRYWQNMSGEERKRQCKIRSKHRKEYFEKMTDEEKADWTEKMTQWVNKPKARAKKVAAVKADWANMDPKKRSEKVRKLALASEKARQVMANRTPEEIEAIAAKKRATRERNKAKRRAQEMLWADD